MDNPKANTNEICTHIQTRSGTHTLVVQRSTGSNFLLGGIWLQKKMDHACCVIINQVAGISCCGLGMNWHAKLRTHMSSFMFEDCQSTETMAGP